MVSTHLKILVKLDHFPRDRDENKKYLKPPPSYYISYIHHHNLSPVMVGYFPTKGSPLFDFHVFVGANRFAWSCECPLARRERFHIHTCLTLLASDYVSSSQWKGTIMPFWRLNSSSSGPWFAYAASRRREVPSIRNEFIWTMTASDSMKTPKSTGPLLQSGPLPAISYE